MRTGAAEIESLSVVDSARQNSLAGTLETADGPEKSSTKPFVVVQLKAKFHYAG